jgi:Zn finger protein HypA/HybF involved in hydrogenase expression
LNITGSRYRCPVCGAELAVIRGGDGTLGPVCCGVEMELLKGLCPVWRCPLCGSEIMAIRGGRNFTPHCCNVAMLEYIAVEGGI